MMQQVLDIHVHCDCHVSTSTSWKSHHRNIIWVIWFVRTTTDKKSGLFQHQCPISGLFRAWKSKTWISGLFRTVGTMWYIAYITVQRNCWRCYLAKTNLWRAKDTICKTYCTGSFGHQSSWHP